MRRSDSESSSCFEASRCVWLLSAFWTGPKIRWWDSVQRRCLQSAVLSGGIHGEVEMRWWWWLGRCSLKPGCASTCCCQTRYETLCVNFESAHVLLVFIWCWLKDQYTQITKKKVFSSLNVVHSRGFICQRCLWDVVFTPRLLSEGVWKSTMNNPSSSSSF